MAGDVDTLLIDKTGTITQGNRRATRWLPLPGIAERDLAAAAVESSLADITPEGRSIVELGEATGMDAALPPGAEAVPFTAETRMSGIDRPGGEPLRKGAADAIAGWVCEQGGEVLRDLDGLVHEVAREGGTPARIGCSPPVYSRSRKPDPRHNAR